MKKNKHPKIFKTKIIQKDKSTYYKKWVYKKKIFELDFDFIKFDLKKD